MQDIAFFQRELLPLIRVGINQFTCGIVTIDRHAVRSQRIEGHHTFYANIAPDHLGKSISPQHQAGHHG
ncbi:hypothetical protein NBRC106471_1886 [Acetobacter pasteurianus subsp. pasteurianus LMG 1262 = NBRC 106471]|nr:hypothetical protein NBRC106471_1886 [Acetobacter pasteurianus subsp. pasteurianus LMG 1262 = NBRC 106471]